MDEVTRPVDRTIHMTFRREVDHRSRSFRAEEVADQRAIPDDASHRAMGYSFGGQQISQIYASNDQHPVILELKPEFQRNAASLKQLSLTSKTGALVPLNRKYGIAEIIDVCKRFPLKRRSRITFEYVLLAGVNDAPEDARRLAKLLAGVKAKNNVIPLNPAAGIPFERPADAVIDQFARILSERGALVSVRKSRGRDIRAACGQLIVEGQKKSPAQRLAVAAFGR